jgi:uncharacterized membrane protein
MSNTLLTVVVPVIIGTIAIAGSNILRRSVMKDGAISALQCLIISYSVATLVFGVVYVYLWGFTLPKVLPGMWTAVFFGAMANVIMQFLKVKAASIDEGEVSLTAPLQAMTPGLITGLALLLGEYPSKIGVAGIALMIVGSYVLMWDKAPKHWYEYFGPIKRIIMLTKLNSLSREERNKTIVTSLALGSACIGTIGLLFDGLYTRRSLSMQGLVLASMGLVAILLIIYVLWYLVRPDGKPTKEFYRNLKIATLIPIFVMGILWVISVVVINPAYNQTFVAYVGTLKRFHIIVSVILGFFIFREKEFKKRFWAAVLIVLGVALIATDDLPSRLTTTIEGLGI